MSLPPVGLPKLPVSPEQRIYEAVIAHVTSDPLLSSVVQSFTHTPFMFSPPPLQRLPMIRIEAGSGTYDTQTMTTDRVTMMIGFVLTVANGDHRDLMNLWSALRACIKVHHDDWLTSALAAANVHDLNYGGMMWRQPAITYQPIPETRALESTAVLEIFYRIKDC